MPDEEKRREDEPKQPEEPKRPEPLGPEPSPEPGQWPWTEDGDPPPGGEGGVGP